MTHAFARRFWLLCVLLLALSACTSLQPCNDQPCTRVLFIGNSYTYVNDLPGTFAGLAKSGGYQVEVKISAQGGWTLADHVNSADTLNTLRSTAWDYVILQEQSQIPAVAEARELVMYPAARSLVNEIRNVGATPIFFVTWAHRDGYPEKGINYETMQARINQGYGEIASQLNVPIAPVGNAWFTAIRSDAQLSLWQDDGSHPNEQGTYLAAAVFYAVIFQESPEGLRYHAKLSKGSALFFQEIAARLVLNGQ